MTLIKESVIKKYSVLLPYIGGFISLALILLQSAMDNQLISIEHQLIIISLVIPGLAHIGRLIKQSPSDDSDSSEG